MEEDKAKNKKKEFARKYFQENKESIYKSQKKWREKNKEKWVKSLYESRKRRVQRLREEGVVNPWGVVVKGSKPRYEKEK